MVSAPWVRAKSTRRPAKYSISMFPRWPVTSGQHRLPLLQAEQRRRLLRVADHRHDHPVEEPGDALDDVEVAVGHRVERPRNERRGHDVRSSLTSVAQTTRVYLRNNAPRLTPIRPAIPAAGSPPTVRPPASLSEPSSRPRPGGPAPVRSRHWGCRRAGREAEVEGLVGRRRRGRGGHGATRRVARSANPRWPPGWPGWPGRRPRPAPPAGRTRPPATGPPGPAPAPGVEVEDPGSDQADGSEGGEERLLHPVAGRPDPLPRRHRQPPPAGLTGDDAGSPPSLRHPEILVLCDHFVPIAKSAYFVYCQRDERGRTGFRKQCQMAAVRNSLTPKGPTGNIA